MNMPLWLEQRKTDILMAKLSEGTRPAYQGHWKSWVLFQYSQEKPLYLKGGNLDDVKNDEEVLLEYIVFLSRIMMMKTGSITQELFALRHKHLVKGISDPLLGKTRIFTALKKLKRLEDPVRRKHPFTARLL